MVVWLRFQFHAFVLQFRIELERRKQKTDSFKIIYTTLSAQWLEQWQKYLYSMNIIITKWVQENRSPLKFDLKVFDSLINFVFVHLIDAFPLKTTLEPNINEVFRSNHVNSIKLLLFDWQSEPFYRFSGNPCATPWFQFNSLISMNVGVISNTSNYSKEEETEKKTGWNTTGFIWNGQSLSLPVISSR